jgi:hypothetical protein
LGGQNGRGQERGFVSNFNEITRDFRPSCTTC